MFHTFIWMTGSPADRATTTTLEAMLDSLASRGGCQDLTVVGLDGSDELLASANSRTRAAGAAWADGRAVFQAIQRDFPLFQKIHGGYETRCLLRWLVLRRLLEGATSEQTWHIDSDMLFFAGLDELARDTAGKTFVLQGCPAFTSISDPRWFEAYEEALRALHDTREPGFQVTDEVRERHRAGDAERGNASVYRIPPASDQDLMQCLIGQGLLPQDPWAIARGNFFYYMQNPLCLGAWHNMDAGTADAEFEDRTDGIVLGDRRVPFVHFQADAARFFLAHRRARSLGVSRWLPHPLSDPTSLASEFSWRYSLATKFLAPRPRLDRAKIMRESVRPDPRTGTRALTDALNHLLGGVAR